MVICLLFLKKNGILHCDIKPENILFKENNKNVKVIDFGSSSFSNETSYFYLQTRPYRAPELVAGNFYDFSIDMWSLGCIMFELITSSLLFPYKNSIENFVKALSINSVFDVNFYQEGENAKSIFHKGKYIVHNH